VFVEDVVSLFDLLGFDNLVMDGYVVMVDDVVLVFDDCLVRLFVIWFCRWW